MKQIQISSYGNPEKLRLIESPIPQPRPGEVLVKVKAAGINFADILARQGLYPDAPKAPTVVGYEVSGVIEAVGNEVKELKEGQEVFCLTRFGGYSEYVAVPEIQVFPKPKRLSFEQAAALPVVYLTAWALISVSGNLKHYETILIHNAGSSMGLASLEIAKHIGAKTIGTASTRKHAFLKKKGYDHLIDYYTTDWVTKSRELTNGRGVELCIDPIGGKNWKKSFRTLRSTGRLGVYGMASISAAGIKGKLKLAKGIVQTPIFHPFAFLSKNKGVFGVNLGHLWRETEKVNYWALDILKGLEEGWINPHVDSTFSFEEAANAHQYIEDRKSTGKVILIP